MYDQDLARARILAKNALLRSGSNVAASAIDAVYTHVDTNYYMVFFTTSVVPDLMVRVRTTAEGSQVTVTQIIDQYTTTEHKKD